MKTKLDINDIKDKIYLKLTPSGWAIKLRSFIYSKEFDDILLALVKQVNDGKRFTPSLKNIFNAFEQCPYNELKLVIVTHNINHKLESSTGIPYCSDDDNCLDAIYDEINRTIYNNTDLVKRLPDLSHWSKQGILLLNTNFVFLVYHKNKNIRTGDWRLLNLTLPPFNLPEKPLYEIIDSVNPEPPMKLYLYSREQIVNCLKR
jgi:uracil-DNA glycosylase